MLKRNRKPKGKPRGKPFQKGADPRRAHMGGQYTKKAPVYSRYAMFYPTTP